MSLLRIFAALGSALGAATLATDRRIVRRLRNANATEAARACPIPDGRLLVSWRLRRLVAAGALATQAPGAYYLVESGWRAWRARRRRRALTIVGTAILATLLVLSLFGR